MNKVVYLFVFVVFFHVSSFAQTRYEYDESTGPYFISLIIDYVKATKSESEKFIVKGYAQFSSDNGIVEVLIIPPTTLDDQHRKAQFSENQKLGRMNKSIQLYKFTSKTSTRDERYIYDTYNYAINFKELAKTYNRFPEDFYFIEIADGVSIRLSSQDVHCNEEEFRCGIFNFVSDPTEFYIGEASKDDTKILREKLNIHKTVISE